METRGGRDRWRDEERDTNSSIRRDKWKEGDKEPVETRKTDRWIENPSRRALSDRWSDSSNRESNFDQRRESKWNTRWGPDDKETDNDPINNHAKDEREGDHIRPWRSNSSQMRGNLQNLTQNKQPPTFAYGRGRARVNQGGISGNSHSQSLTTVADKGESGHGESSPLTYSRTKLLDVYRITDMRSHRKLLDGFTQVPSLTQEEPLEPLGFHAPTSEELVIYVHTDTHMHTYSLNQKLYFLSVRSCVKLLLR